MRPQYWARSVVEALEKVGAKGADEVHVIYFLVTQARWTLRPEFESPFSSNVTLPHARTC